MARLSQHVPFLQWVPSYRKELFLGDLMGALTVSSLYVPLSVSFALLGHAHPISGLYSFVINPFLYALLGTCPLMVVGPEAPGSLLVGTMVAASYPGNETGEDDIVSAQIAGTVTACTGVILFVAGLGRLGYVNSILSRPFMRGIIGALGLSVLIQQALTGLGLGALARKDPNVGGGSAARKLLFVMSNLGQTHILTAIISLTSFAVIMVLRHFRTSLENRHRAVAYIPDRFVVVASSAALTWLLGWHEQGLQVLGQIQTPETNGLPFHWPFTLDHISSVSNLITTAFLIALLGLFESSLTAKSLRQASGGNNATSLVLDADQELIALGAANLIGGCFLALPSFGGYGRSKLNYSTGGRTPMSNVLLSAITLLCILTLLPAFYYLPRGVLAAMIAVVGVSMIEECPHEIMFFAKIQAWPELALMATVFVSTICYSVSLGMALGLAWSILAAVVHGGWRTTVRILDVSSPNALGHAELAQIASLCPMRTILVTVPGPLTFVNTGDLKDRVDALDQMTDSSPRIPHRPETRSERKLERVLIFDMRHCPNVDGCAVQNLTEIAEHYALKENRVIIWEPLRLQGRDNILHKLTLSRAMEAAGGNVSLVSSLDELLATLGVEGHPDSVFEPLDI
ncbi:hypothetical protein H2200_001122 [Cladophialophora chaetospira]|uniref:STAS domain-containing protein n=1 Tax=Cladophialophora chaetospira TaxID=386627 RepID=A0AA38XKD9_9EURO|nr:hypothetical protein H2200_001122 [Cladophialophora chaetospira]